MHIFEASDVIYLNLQTLIWTTSTEIEPKNCTSNKMIAKQVTQ